MEILAYANETIVPFKCKEGAGQPPRERTEEERAQGWLPIAFPFQKAESMPGNPR